MDPRDLIISRIADRECQRISRKVVRCLQRMTKGMQSGDDSGLRNVWDEGCVQVQGEHSVMWDVYLETIRDMITGHLANLDGAVKQAIWLQTNSGMEWDPDDEDNDIFYADDEIADYILSDYLLFSAADWTNGRIEKFKERDMQMG